MVAVQLSTLFCHVSAVCSYVAALASSPFRRARSAAQISPAISEAIVPGDQPSWFSQRSMSVFGPVLTSQSAAGLTCRA